MLLKGKILSKVHKKTKYKVSDIRCVLDAYHEVIYESLLNDDGYKYNGFGLKVSIRNPKPFIDISTRKPSIIPMRKKVMLNISRGIQDSLKEEWKKEDISNGK